MKKYFLFTSIIIVFFFSIKCVAQNKIHKSTNSKVSTLSTNELLQGQWQSVDDKTFVITFDKNKTTLFNDCGENNCATFSLETYPKFVKIVCDQYSSCCYRIIAINKDILTLGTDGSGGDILKYKRTKG
jgi:hypothetical protein